MLMPRGVLGAVATAKRAFNPEAKFKMLLKWYPCQHNQAKMVSYFNERELRKSFFVGMFCFPN